MEKSEKVKRSDGDAINMETVWLYTTSTTDKFCDPKSRSTYTAL